MKIQSISIMVPPSFCVNHCKFCVSRMRDEFYPSRISTFHPEYAQAVPEYLKRLEFASRCNTAIITGTCEPLQNKEFLAQFALFHNLVGNPFKNIEIQTAGSFLEKNNILFLRDRVGVTTVSLSLASLNQDENTDIVGNFIDFEKVCAEVREAGLTLRLSLNMTSRFDAWGPENLFQRCSSLGANQVTLRVLYAKGDSPESRWVAANSCQDVSRFDSYIQKEGRFLEILEYGAARYSLQGLSVVLDRDCMSSQGKDVLKYLVLRPNCRLYSKWDDPASLIF